MQNDTIDGQYMARAEEAHKAIGALSMEDRDMLALGQTPESMRTPEPEQQPEVADQPDMPRVQAIMQRFEEGAFPDTAKGIRSGLFRGLKNTVQAVVDFGTWMGDEYSSFLTGEEAEEPTKVDLGQAADDMGITPARPESTSGQLAEGLSQFLVAFAGPAKMLKGVKFGNAVAGGLADFFAFDEHEERLSNIVQNTPLANPLTEYLAAGPDDGEAEGRLKNVAEGVLTGGLVDGLVKGAKALKEARAFRNAMAGLGELQPGMSIKDVSMGDFMAGSKSGTQTVAIDPVGIIPQPNTLPTPKRMAGNINLDRLDSPEAIKEMIAEVSENYAGEIDSARRGVITEEQTRELARELGMTEETLLKRRKGEAYNAEQLLAARWVLLKSADEWTQMGEQLAEAASMGRATDEMRAAWKTRTDVHAMLQAQFSGAAAESGRSQRSLQMMAAKEEVSNLRLRQMSDIIKASGGREDIDNMAAQMVAQMREMGELDLASVNQFIKGVQKATFKDGLLEVWYAFLLGNPVTHMANIAGNTLFQAWMVPERALAAGVSRMPIVGSKQIALREVGADLYGSVEGFRDGLRLFAKGAWDILNFKRYDGADLAWKAEEPHRAVIAAQRCGLDQTGKFGRAVDLFGELARTPGKGLRLEDDFFKAIGYRRELRARAVRQADREGLSGAAFSNRVNEIVANPPDDIQLAAIDFARYTTFTNETEKWVHHLQMAANDNILIKVVLPFVRTSYNITRATLERMPPPLSAVARSVRADIMAGGARRDTAIARIALGSMVMAAVTPYALDGTITGGGPKRGMEKSYQRDTGWQPYSVKIGGKYYSFSRLEPVGSLLAVAADAADIMQRTDDPEVRDNISSIIAIALAKSATSKTFMQGVADSVNALSDPERYGEDWLARLAGTVIPGGVAQANRTFVDDTMRSTHGWLDQIKSRTPGLSLTLPARTDAWGHDIKYGDSWGPDILSPIYTSEEQRATASRELLRLEYYPAAPARNVVIEGVTVPLGQWEHYRFKQLVGHAVKDPTTGLGFEQTVEALVDGSHPLAGRYAQLTDGPDGGKVQMIKEYRRTFTELAKQQLAHESRTVRDFINDEQFTTQQRMGGGDGGRSFF